MDFVFCENSSGLMARTGFETYRSTSAGKQRNQFTKKDRKPLTVQMRYGHRRINIRSPIRSLIGHREIHVLSPLNPLLLQRQRQRQKNKNKSLPRRKNLRVGMRKKSPILGIKSVRKPFRNTGIQKTLRLKCLGMDQKEKLSGCFFLLILNSRKLALEDFFLTAPILK